MPSLNQTIVEEALLNHHYDEAEEKCSCGLESIDLRYYGLHLASTLGISRRDNESTEAVVCAVDDHDHMTTLDNGKVVCFCGEHFVSTQELTAHVATKIDYAVYTAYADL